MTAAIEGKLVISICAGVTLSQLRSWVPASTEVVRAMPNTPCKVRLTLFSLIDKLVNTDDEYKLISRFAKV